MSFDTVRFSRADINNINLGKRRPLNPLNWADRKNKNNKDKSLAYKVLKGRRAGLTIPAIIQPTGEKFCPCKKAGCCQDPKFYTDLYKSFREINADQQNQLLAECLEIQEPKSRRIDPKNAIKIKKHSYSYSVKVRGRRIPVCRMRLLDTFKVTNNRIRTIISKLESGKVTFEDGRGKTTGVHQNLLSEDFKESIRSHIRSFPRYDSHYCRGDAGENRQYLDAELSVKKMVALFNEVQAETDERVCQYDAYNNIFKTEFDLRFGLPRKDSCNFCDEEKAFIARSTIRSQVKLHEKMLSDHLLMAKKAREMHKADPQSAQEAKVSITADMQKVLFVPRLSCSSAYFKRKLSTFNLGIHFTGTTEAKMFLWDETIAMHTSKDVISCIYKLITKRVDKLKQGEKRKFLLWSDRFVGQFNNSYMILFLKFLVDKAYFSQADHKFFITGHSWMSCDRDFGLIEKQYLKLNPIIPEDIADVVASARPSHPFLIHKMSQVDFLDFNSLTNFVTLPTSLHVTKFHWFRYDAEQKNYVFAKVQHSEIEKWQKFQLVTKQSTQFEGFAKPTRAYHKPIQIHIEKAKDLRVLMTKIPDRRKYKFYDNLTKFVL